MATMLGPRFRRLRACRASTSRVSFSGARACWIELKLRLWPHSTNPAPISSTNGPVMPRGITWVITPSSQSIDSSVQ